MRYKFCSTECSLEVKRTKRNECSAHYRAKVRNQTPKDVDRKAIQEFYANCTPGMRLTISYPSVKEVYIQLKIYNI